MVKLPKIIGHPGYQSIDGAKYVTPGESIDGHEKLIDRSLQIVYMMPLETKMSASINIYEARPAVDEYIEFLNANGVDEGEAFSENNSLKIACHNITPLSETYSNEYGQSELFGSLQQIGNGALGELAQITGFNGRSTINAYADHGSNATLKALASAAKDGLDFTEDLLSKAIGSYNARTLVNGLSNPAAKIDIPQMWKGNSFSAQYEITVRLQCFNVSDDNSYLSNVVAPLIAFMQFVCPRTKTENFYTWPFLVAFEIPGLVKLPMAYCSNLSVIKGGDVNDISWKWRPNVIDCRMTINTIWGVTTNSTQNTPSNQRPTIRKEFDVLSSIGGNSAKSSSGSGFSSYYPTNNGSSSRTGTTSQNSEDAAEMLTNIYGSNLSTIR